MVEEYDYLFKSIVVGDGGVGKTALTLRFSKGFFTEDYKMTIGVDFHVKTISIDTFEGPIKCKLQLWDTGGQERFSSIRPMYYRGSLGTILVFDLTNSASFEHLPQWIEEVRANIKADIPVLLVGNKSDLTNIRAVSVEEINNFTRDFNLYYMETSAKTGDGVGDCFQILACLMIGQGVPDQLISNATVYAPGEIIKGSEPVEKTIVQPIIPKTEYLAPPVPELVPNNTKQEPAKFEPEPELEYEAPPVPEPKITYPKEPRPIFEPEPELEYEAPPVPEPTPVPQPHPNPEFFTPEPTDIEFKTPDQIMAEKFQPSEQVTTTTDKETYKPNTIPFTKNAPIPAPTPKEFQIPKAEHPTESSSSQTPFRVTKKKEAPKPLPAFMTFEPKQEVDDEPSDQAPVSQSESSESLVDYMPKKELKRLAKEKKKQDKEKSKIEKEKKISEQRVKQGELFEGMKTSKKSKKEKKSTVEGVTSEQKSSQVSPSSEPSLLFQTLTQRPEEIPEESSESYVPFTAIKKDDGEEKSKLRIIPNVADIDRNFTSFTSITSSHPFQEEKQKEKKNDLLICEQCGTTLSSDYAFCNKCGNKL
ncbi:MAG: GTP-binding protein [Candidatus Lokiarchaeota archaeon]|nr:GTP-binding protein [Candidatus Lokiarchaeota archaeon]